jgi:hypothetical protein
MSEERAVPLPEWPQPDAGAPSPVTLADDTTLFVRYLTQAGKIAVVYFPLCSVFTFGSPNDEALGGHPLYGRGLKFYSVHRVEHSSWIALLERQNSVHSRHDRKRFLEDKKHFVFTFHDSTLECVVNEGKFWPTEISQFDNDADADAHIQKKKRA